MMRIDPEFADLPPEIALMRQREFERNYAERFGEESPESVVKQTLSEEYDWEARQKRLQAKYGPKPHTKVEL